MIPAPLALSRCLRLGLAGALACAALPAGATTVGPLLTLDASPGTATQRAPAVAWDGTRYVVVWEDSRASGSGVELFLARIGVDGAIQDAMGIPVLSPPVTGNQTLPQIAWNGSAFVMTWVDPRGGRPEIYVSRFFGDGMGLLPEPGGIPLTNTTAAAETAPAIGCAVQSCLVAFQQISAGVTSLRGTRVYPSGDLQDLTSLDLVADTTGATSEIQPAVTATTAAFYVAWEDDRNRASGNLGADLFVRTVPDLGMVMASPGTLLTSAPYRQSSASLAMISPSSLMAVWEDQRTSTTTAPGTEDLWRARFTLNLGAQGTAGALVAAPREQLRPRLSARNGSGLMVWSDFRNGPVGATYATRVDANGAALDRDGFPVLVQNGTLIEHAVVRGPNNDFLVIGVRSTPSPARIVYRIVRGEDPAGTMMASGTLTVPADGTTAAAVAFGPARGASGFPVVDGTRYTLTLSRADVTITAPDVDAARPGHQLQTVDGRLAFGLTSLGAGMVTVTVASDAGTSVGTTMVDFRNVAPTVTDLVISPAMPRSDQDLTLTYVYRDINGDAESGSRIQWTRDGMLMPAYEGQLTVPEVATRRREIWRAQVQARDGIDFAQAFVFSTPVTILNTPPSAADVSIRPNTMVRTGTALRAEYRYVDPDQDAETNSSLRWTLNGAEDVALRGQRDVPAARVSKGQTWHFSVVPSDGTDVGPRVGSSTVTVENTVPVASAGANGDVLERRGYTLDAGGSSDADPQDALTYRWTQTGGPPVVLSSNTTRTATFTAPSVTLTTPLEFSLVVSDGESDSPPDTVVVLIGFVPDRDGDDLDDEEEALVGTDPARADTDRDGLEDGEEYHTLHTDPLDEDSDDDGVRDGQEMDPGGDADGDMLINALDPDADGDGLWDGTEIGLISAPDGTDMAAMTFVADADRTTTTNARAADTDGDGLSDGMEDSNKNGRVDLGESDPNDATSTVGCMPDRTCPSGLACIEDACRAPPAPDGGLTCTPIANQNLECCTACFAGTAVAPVCNMPGRAEQCPAGSAQCSIGSCSAPVTPPAESGCGCTTSSSADPTGVLALLVIAGLVVRRRRRG